MLFALICLILIICQRCMCKCGIKKIKYSQILKKFETGSRHLELNTNVEEKKKTRGGLD